jgi:DNA polymerase-1
MGKTLFLIDGHSQLYQAYWAIRGELSSPAGVPTGAVYGFTNMLRRILNQHPDYVAVVFDTGKPTFRHRRYPEYKANRPPMPDDLIVQIGYVEKVLRAWGIPILRREGYEADDVIGTLARRAAAEGLEVRILTRDKDVLQLLGPHVAVYDNTKDRLITEADLEAERGLKPEQVVDWLGLAGDTSDNVPGVPGIGDKTALALIHEFGSLEAVLAGADRVSGQKRQENLRQFADQARLSRELVTIDTAVPIEVDFDSMRFTGGNRQQLLQLFRELGFQSFLNELMAAAEAERGAYELVTPDRFEEFLALLSRRPAFAFDVETTSTRAMQAELVGISFSWEAGTGYYLPVRGPALGASQLLDRGAVLERLRPILESPTVAKWGQHLKYDCLVLRGAGIRVAGVTFDCLLAAYLIDPDSPHDLDSLAVRYLQFKPTPIKDLIGTGKKQKTLDQVPLAAVCAYSCEDADLVVRLKALLEPRLEELGLGELFRNVELPLSAVLEEVEFQGVRVDTGVLADLSRSFGERLQELQTSIYSLAGEPFNIDSTKQLGGILFDKLGLPRVKRTKTGYSTDASVLERLAVLHELPRLLLEHRALSKLKGTYVDTLPQLVNPATGRIHASFSQTVAATGRLSCSDPNLQNIPVRSEAGGQIRRAFVPGEPGSVLLSADYSQIELRILAHLSGDGALREVFLRGEDVHRFVAGQIFGVPESAVTSEQRRQAKAVSFGVIYGLSPYGLSAGVGVPVPEARDFIDAYFDRYPGVEAFIHRTLREAKDRGYVTTILNRRRYVSGVKGVTGRNFGQAERVAINAGVQGSAADMIKVAMNNIFRRVADEARPSRLLVQIHDELLFEVPAEAVATEAAMVEEEMCQAIPLSVPVEVNLESGSNWLEMEPLQLAVGQRSRA